MAEDEEEEEEVEYELETFQIHQFQVEILTVAYLPITTLLANRTKEKEISGQKLWCGSLCLVNYLFKDPNYLKNSVIIELGAGTGVVSIIASKLNGEPIIATDHDERSLQHMREDFPRNHVNIHVQALNWYSPQIELVDSVVADYPSKERVLILAGDVLYKSVLLQPFFQTVQKILSLKASSNNELLLCHIPRADVPQERVQQTLQELSFHYSIVPPEQWNYGELLSQYCPIEDIERAQMYKITL